MKADSRSERSCRSSGRSLTLNFQRIIFRLFIRRLRITSEGFDVETTIDVVAEVQQHLGEGRVRAVSMLPTDGMVRGMKVIDLGGPITVPVGECDAWAA